MLRMDFTKVRTTCALPAKWLAKLRSAGPVVEVCFPIIGKAWTITTSELAGCILEDNVTFTMRKDGDVAEFRWWMPGLDLHARGEHVDYGRARPYAPADRRRSLPVGAPLSRCNREFWRSLTSLRPTFSRIEAWPT
jgi:hypothetical protein